MEDICTLPNGCHLFREPNGVGGYRYYTDEIGALVWDTCIVNECDLLAAILEEKRRTYLEYHVNERLVRANKIWNLLVKEAAALEDYRSEFLLWFKLHLPFYPGNKKLSSREFRFGGKLGCIDGKIYFCEQMLDAYIDYYPGGTEERKNIINKQLKEIH